MSRTSAALANSANFRGEQPFRRSGTDVPLNAAVAKVANRLWPSKTDVQMAACVGATDRACRYWLSGDRTLSADALARLLRSEDGFEFLVAVMGEAKPAWWVWCLRVMAIAGIRRRQRAEARLLDALRRGDDEAARKTRKKMRSAIDAHDALSAAIERADALLHGDPDFYSAHADGLREMAGRDHRPVASQAKGRGRR